MKCKLILPIAMFVMFLSAALSTGDPLFFMAAVFVVLLVVGCLISVLRVSATLSVEVTLSEKAVRRGDDVTMSLTVRHKGLIPVAPIRLDLVSLPDAPSGEVLLKDVPGRAQQLTLPFHAAHVGVSEPGIRRVVIEDLMGIFTYTRNMNDSLGELIVLPQTFEIDPLEFSPGDPGSESMAKATEDVSSPSDIRGYQPGDSIKKIHWKLSLRKNELLVRRYDEPILQDALILMDCSRPPSWGHSEAEADIRDALLETTASVYNVLSATDHGFRIPLTGRHPVDVDRNTGTSLAFDNFCRVDFSAEDSFERVLQMESAHLRSVGSVVIISARLNSNLVDMMANMHRMGPALRLYLVTYAPNDTRVLPLIGKLRQAGIEVSYVTPVPT